MVAERCEKQHVDANEAADILACYGWTVKFRGLRYGVQTVEIAKPGFGAIRVLGGTEAGCLTRALQDALASEASR